MSLFTQEEIARVGRCGEVFAGEYAHEGLQNILHPHILDIGANIGAFAVWASRYWPGSFLTMFEPNLHIADRRAQLLKDFNVQCVDHCVGVSENAGKLSLYDVGRDIDGMTTTLHGHRSARVLDADAFAASDLPPADIVKLDCEGAECFVLAHYNHWPVVKAVLIEWHTVPNRVFAEYVLSRQRFTCLRGFGEEGVREGFDISYGCQVWVRT